ATVVEKVAGRIPVIVDGGVRRGTDVLKAMAYGASAVMIGRPYVHGLAVNGAAGVEAVIGILRHELELAMALSGTTSITKANRGILRSSCQGAHRFAACEPGAYVSPKRQQVRRYRARAPYRVLRLRLRP